MRTREEQINSLIKYAAFGSPVGAAFDYVFDRDLIAAILAVSVMYLLLAGLGILWKRALTHLPE